MSPAGGEFSPQYFAKRCWDIASIGLISSITVLSINPFSFIGDWLLDNFKGKSSLGVLNNCSAAFFGVHIR